MRAIFFSSLRFIETSSDATHLVLCLYAVRGFFGEIASRNNLKEWTYLSGKTGRLM
jgi:hypothetical protein